MKVRISLENAPNCELDSALIAVDYEAEVSDAVKGVLAGWTICFGDTVKIREVE